jgi:large subunit ribosomal protein L21
MYAIIRTGGHQEKVSPGEVISVDRRKESVGDTITFTPLMVHKDDGSVVSDKAELGQGEASVVGTIVKHVRADKIDVFQYRNKTGYRRHTGHRQPLTLVEISEIRFAGQVALAPEPEPEPETPTSTAGEPEVKPTKKSTAKKKTTAKKPAAKKPTAKKTAKKPAKTE